MGSHEGCGCGFQLGEHPGLDDDAPAKRETLRRFAAYLDSQLDRGRGLEIFACWDGDQVAPAERHRTLLPSELLGEPFFFHDREHVTVAGVS
ncbi:MAG: hypothetical protein R3F05_19335 [Planctomycetota bacterium]